MAFVAAVWWMKCVCVRVRSGITARYTGVTIVDDAVAVFAASGTAAVAVAVAVGVGVAIIFIVIATCNGSRNTNWY